MYLFGVMVYMIISCQSLYQGLVPCLSGSLRTVIISLLCFKEKMLKAKDLRVMNKKMKILKVRKCVN